MHQPFIFATGIENSYPTIRGGTHRVDEMELCATVELYNRLDVALVDVEDWERVTQYKWHLNQNKKRKNHRYVQTNVPVNGKYTTTSLHRFVMSANSGDIIDHINGDTLDCRKINLRRVTPTQNSQNQSTRSDNTSGQKGVQYRKERNRWWAGITVNKKTIHLGYFRDFDEAVNSYKDAEMKYFGEFRRVE